MRKPQAAPTKGYKVRNAGQWEKILTIVGLTITVVGAFLAARTP
jgi:hypothetical protein